MATLSWAVLPALPPSSRTRHVRCCGMRRVAMTRRKRRGRVDRWRRGERRRREVGGGELAS